MAPVHEVADTYIEQKAGLDPIEATRWGVPWNDHRLPDLSPDGYEKRARLLGALASCPKDGDLDRIAAEVMSERLSADLEPHEACDHLRSLRVLFTPHGSVRLPPAVAGTPEAPARCRSTTLRPLVVSTSSRTTNLSLEPPRR